MVWKTTIKGAAIIMAIGVVANTAYGQVSRGDRYSGAPWATRSPVLAQHGMAATEQPLASQIAIDILKKGGSAVDAAIAANAALGLMEPVLERHGRRSFRHRVGSQDEAALRLQRLGPRRRRAAISRK